MASLDPWETLGVAPGASKAKIRRAYRRLAQRYHPDLNPGDPEAEERFKEVQAAYEALTKRSSRREPRRQPSSADEDPFLSIFAAYIRRRRGGNQ